MNYYVIEKYDLGFTTSTIVFRGPSIKMTLIAEILILAGQRSIKKLRITYVTSLSAQGTFMKCHVMSAVCLSFLSNAKLCSSK